MNARGEAGKEGEAHAAAAQYVTLLYLAIINIWSHISYPLCSAYY